MDTTPRMGGVSEKNPTDVHEYTAQVTSSLIDGDANLTVGEDGLTIVSVFDGVDISYADIQSFSAADYAVRVVTREGVFSFGRMGYGCESFYHTLSEAYNKKVQRALLISDPPILTANGNYRYNEKATENRGNAAIQIHGNCVCVLPPDIHARRIPLCFLTGMDKGVYEVALRLDTDDTYTFAKLGYDTVPFVDSIEKQVRSMREKTLSEVRELDSTLSSAQASAVARLMPEGAAAPLGRINTVAPSFVRAIEREINNSRAAETYRELCKICDPARIYVGFKKNHSSGRQKDGESVSDGLFDGSANENDLLGDPVGRFGGGDSQRASPSPDPYILWIMAPSADGKKCAVEFAGDVGDAAATFIYRFDGGFDPFAWSLNHALEAIGFRREIIWLSDDELMTSKKDDSRMTVERNRDVRFVRSCFVGRAIHRSMDSWKKTITDYFGGQ